MKRLINTKHFTLTVSKTTRKEKIEGTFAIIVILALIWFFKVK